MDKVKLSDLPVGTVFRAGSKLFQKVANHEVSHVKDYKDAEATPHNVINLQNNHRCILRTDLGVIPIGPDYPTPQEVSKPVIEPLAVNRILNEETRVQEFVLGGVVYSLHRTNREVLVTATNDYSKVYQITSKGFYESMKEDD